MNSKADHRKELPDPPLYPGAQNDDLLRQAEVLRKKPNQEQEEKTKKPWYKNFGYSSKAASIDEHLGR